VTETEETGRLDGPTAATSVANDLAALVIGRMAPGNSLPSEAELAQRYSVSRLTIREAVKMLAGRGLLELSRGRKAVVREPDGSVFGEFLTSITQYDPKAIFDLVEVRLSLEVQSAGLAAKRASRPALSAIESALSGMREAAAEGQNGLDPDIAEKRFHGHDLDFHLAVAMASGNRVLVYLFEAMASPLEEAFFISRRGHRLRGHTLDDTIAAHQLVLDRIAEGKQRAAAEAMRAHLQDTERDIRASVATLTLRGSEDN